MDAIYEFELFDEDDVEKFVKAYMTGESQAELHNMLSPPIDRYKVMDEEEQDAFKKKMRK